MNLKKGTNYTFRLNNIIADGTDLTVSILNNGVPVNWRAKAKDGGNLPKKLQIIKPAINQPISIGQSFNFKFNPAKTGKYVFAVKDYRDSIILTNNMLVH